MTSMIMWAWVWVLGIALYFNVGYAYVEYMNTYKSSDSRLRRFLAGGWNWWGNPSQCSRGPVFVTFWIIFFIPSMGLWVVWIIWKIIYFIFGGFAKEVMKEKKDEK